MFDLDIKVTLDMKRLYILLFFILHSSFFIPVCHAHGRLEEAFRTLLAMNQHPLTFEDEGLAPAATQLLIPAEQLPLILDVYQAMEEEHATRTVFFRQDLGSACANGIELQGRDFKFAGQYNNILGGFTDPTTTPTIYRWYYLAWRPDPEQGTIVGYIVMTQEVANTQQPNIREPMEPSYQPLLTAIKEFKNEYVEASSISSLFTKLSTNLYRHSDFEMSAAATGKWIYKWKTFGFNLPVSAEQELIAPLYQAFLEVQPRAYRFLNKRAGETAEDVQIVVNHTGRTIGLGLQTDWNIIYAYFNDEDFPENRYVYALWYKLDVQSQRIVGELIEVNTPRPNGGQVVPSVQMSVPAYLHRIKSPIATNTVGSLNNVPQTDNRQHSSNGLVVTEINVNTGSPQQMETALNEILAISTWSDDWLARGFDREAMALEYKATLECSRNDRSLYSEELRHYTDAYNTTTANARTYMQASLDSVKADFTEQTRQLNVRRSTMSRDDYERQMTALFELYRQQLDTVTIHYKATVDALTAGYETGIRAIASRHPIENPLLTADGSLTSFGQRLFKQMLTAYQGGLSTADATLSERIRTFVRAVSITANAKTRSDILKSLRKAAKRGNRHARSRQIIKQAINILTIQQQ